MAFRAKDDSAVGYESDAAWDAVASRYGDAGEQWRARRVTFFKNGDPWFQGLQMRFVPGRDYASLEALCAKISDRMDLPNGARYVFAMDGSRVRMIQFLLDGASYVCSSTRTFQKVPYGMQTLERRTQPGSQEVTTRHYKPRRHRVKPLSPVLRRGFKTGAGAGSGDTNGKTGRRSGDGRIIKIVSNTDHSVQSRVLLNLKTTQPFEDVLADLGQVVRVKDASKMYTTWGQEVKSFSQLRNDFPETDTFYLAGGGPTAIRGTKVAADPAFRTIVDQKQETALLRRYNSEPAMQVGSRKAAPARGRADSASDGTGARGGAGARSAAEKARIRVSLLGQTRSLYRPTKEPRRDSMPPDRRLKLEWAYGYRGADSRHNLWVLPSGELLYYVATVAVLLNRRSDTQRHYTDHTEDIQCMDVHPSKHVVASGQRAGTGSLFGAVRVWGVDRLDTLHLFSGRELQLGVSGLAFSLRNQGAHLLAVDAGEEHLMSVWTWHNQQLLGRVATHQDPVFGAKFHPMDNNLIVTHGKDHLTFWTRRRDGIFDATDLFAGSTRKTVLSVAFEAGGDLITGDSEGFITTWTIDNNGDYRKKLDFEAHSCAVTALLLLSEVTLLSGGERDRKICAWDCEHGYSKRAETRLPEAAGSIRTLCPQRVGTNDGNIYVGTIRNMILEGSMMRRFNTVVFGHSKQLSGLATCNEEVSFVTAGSDRVVAKWSAQRKLIWKSPAHSCAVTALLLLSEVTLLSGGERDRKICAWDCEHGYSKRAETRLPEAAGSIRTLCPQRVGTNDGNIYVGTIRNMILEGSMMRRFNTVVFGHSKQLSGLATCNEEVSFVTAGSDRVVAKWSAQRKLIWKSPVSSEAVSCSVHPLDTVVAVGSADGHLYVYKLSDGTQIGSFRVCGQSLNCVSYSPGGDMLAIGAQTGSVYPFKVGRDGMIYVKFGPMQGSHPITQLDWSVDGEYLQTVTSGHELVYWSKRSLSKEKSPYHLRDKHWATQTCTVGYHVLGAWPDLHYINQLRAWSDSYADAQHGKVLLTACRSREHDLLAVGDSEGGLQLYRYPCPLSMRDTPQCHRYNPQSSHVACARFLRTDRHLVTVGGTDAALLQWRIV
ncbi:echinoderm microtubule-associated protein-like CG42247 [Pollicipes pollicipes]|uniref:echinoderm microtubule-associated protein-like CG42247 n=1 Tax=Pollicipes pollicipes TaxID=41117 RepID=UPI00188599E1|nr:echinoderm microtubule-associated protein-like CG42247 [Pollicipes pollicipes]